MDIFRNIEFPVTTLLLSPKNSDKILDVGCGQSILPSFIANHYHSSITATDKIDVEKIQKDFFKASGSFKLIGDKKFTFTKCLEPLDSLRNDLTVLSGFSHPAVRKVHGHSNADQFLTAAATGACFLPGHFNRSTQHRR